MKLKEPSIVYADVVLADKNGGERIYRRRQFNQWGLDFGRTFSEKVSMRLSDLEMDFELEELQKAGYKVVLYDSKGVIKSIPAKKSYTFSDVEIGDSIEVRCDSLGYGRRLLKGKVVNKDEKSLQVEDENGTVEDILEFEIMYLYIPEHEMTNVAHD